MKKALLFLTVLIILLGAVSAQESFSLKVEILEKSQKIQPGERLYFEVEVKDKGTIGRHDISLEYEIKKDNNIITSSKELKAIETQASFLKAFDIPEDTPLGKYTLYAKIIKEDGKEAVAEHSFEVVEKQIDKQIYYGLAGFFALIFLIYIIFKSKPFLRRLQIRARVLKIVKRKQLK